MEPLKPAPLKNIGSSCFMNAALQAVYAMQDITYLVNQQSKDSIYKKDSLAEAYTDLLPHFMHSDIDDEEIDPSTFCFRGWHQLNDNPCDQADANELLRELLECIAYKDVKDTKWPFFARHDEPNDPDLAQYPEELKTDLAQLFYVFSESKAYADLGEVGFFESDIEVQHSPCLNLRVLPESKNINECLRYFSSPTFDAVAIEGLGPVDGERHTFLQRTGRYIICSLDRKNFIRRTRGQTVPTFTRHENPISFDLYNQSFDQCFKDQSKSCGNYEVIGIIMHSGSANSGHYTAYVKAGSEWYYCNDETITPCSEQEVFKIGQLGYGANKNTLVTTLIYEHSATRPEYALAAKSTRSTSSSSTSTANTRRTIPTSTSSSSSTSSTARTTRNGQKPQPGVRRLNAEQKPPTIVRRARTALPAKTAAKKR